MNCLTSDTILLLAYDDIDLTEEMKQHLNSCTKCAQSLFELKQSYVRIDKELIVNAKIPDNNISEAILAEATKNCPTKVIKFNFINHWRTLVASVLIMASLTLFSLPSENDVRLDFADTNFAIDEVDLLKNYDNELAIVESVANDQIIDDIFKRAEYDFAIIDTELFSQDLDRYLDIL